MAGDDPRDTDAPRSSLGSLTEGRARVDHLFRISTGSALSTSITAHPNVYYGMTAPMSSERANSSGLALSALEPAAFNMVPLTIELADRDISVYLTPAQLPVVKQRLKSMARKEKRRAASAANAASTAQQIGIGIGGTLGGGGLIAALTVSAPLVLGAAIAAGAGAMIVIGGLVAANIFNSRKLEHDEKLDRYNDAVEELK